MDFRILLRRYFLKSLKILFRFLAERLHRFRTVNVLSLVGESYISHREQEQQVGGRMVESDRRKDYKPAGGFRFEGCYYTEKGFYRFAGSLKHSGRNSATTRADCEPRFR